MRITYRSRLKEFNDALDEPLSNAEIARQSGATRQSIIRWMKSDAFEKPDMQVAAELAKLYGKESPYDLLEVIESESDLIAVA